MIDTRRDVLVVPYEKAWIGGPDLLAIPDHGRITMSGAPQDSFPERLRTGPPVPLQGKFLYGGPLKCHFGHVMVDSIIRLWAFDRSRHDGVLFASLDVARPPDWIHDIFDIFGVGRTDVALITAPTVVAELDFALPGSRLTEGPTKAYLEYLESLPLRPAAGTPPKIYFGRSHIPSKGTVCGETYFGELLAAEGFEYVKPEEYDIHTQAAMIANAEVVVFPEGSSIYSIELLARTNARVFMIPRRAGGRKLFAPHIVPRARQFSVLGDPGSFYRLPVGGRVRVSSPAFTRNPRAIYDDLVKHGLIKPVGFDPVAFELAQSRDYEFRMAC